MGYVFAFSMLASIILSTYVYGVYSILLGSIMGFRMERLSVLFITFVREQERMVVKFDKFFLNCNLEMKMKVFNEKKDKLFCYLVAALMLLSSIGVAILMYFYGNKTDELIKAVQDGIVAGFAAFAIYTLYVTISVVKSKLRYRCNAYMKQLKGGAGYEELDFSLEEIKRPKDMNEKKDVETLFRCTLLWMYHFKAYVEGDFETLREIVALKKEYLPMNFQRPYFGCLGSIVFYHTYIEPDMNEARKYYNIAPDLFVQDSDVNGRRILAYYQYYVLDNVALAKQTLEQAKYQLEHADRTQFHEASLRLEREFIQKLEKEIYGIIS